MIEIRNANPNDIERMVFLGREMHAESEYKQYDFDDEVTTRTLTNIVGDSVAGIALVAESDGVIVGGIVGYVAPHYFGKCRVASDLALFVTKEERRGRLALRLINKFIERATELGADQISLGTTTGVESERVKQLYERMGFKHVGYVFHKEI